MIKNKIALPAIIFTALIIYGSLFCLTNPVKAADTTAPKAPIGLTFSLITYIDDRNSCFTNSFLHSLNSISECLLSKTVAKGNYSFAQLSDAHIDKTENPFPESQFKKNLDAAKTSGVSLIVVSGDLINYSSEETLSYYYTNVLAFMKATKIPVFHLPGNHEFFVLRDTAAKAGTQAEFNDTSFEYLGKYFYYIGDTDFDVAFGSARFFMVNNVNSARPRSGGAAVSVDDVYDLYLANHALSKNYAVNAGDFSTYYNMYKLPYMVLAGEKTDLVTALGNTSHKFKFIFTHVPISETWEVTNNCQSNELIRHDLYKPFRDGIASKQNTARPITVFSGHSHPTTSGNLRCKTFQYPLREVSTNTIKNYIAPATSYWTKVDVTATTATVKYIPVGISDSSTVDYLINEVIK